jgi:hypothetical protein
VKCCYLTRLSRAPTATSTACQILKNEMNKNTIFNYI